MNPEDKEICRKLLRQRRLAISAAERARRAEGICRLLVARACQLRLRRGRSKAPGRGAFKLAIFLPLPEEPNLWPAWSTLNSLGFSLYAPRVLPAGQLGWAPLPSQLFKSFFRAKLARSETAAVKVEGGVPISSNKQLLFRDPTGLLLEKKLKASGWAVSSYGILEPPETACCTSVQPHLIFLPCLGVDLNGVRMGYGGGYYDRFLSQIKAREKQKKGTARAVKVAVCYREQVVEVLPKAPWDESVDAVISG